MLAELLALRPQICRMGGRKFGEDLFQNVCVALLARSNDPPRSSEALIRHIARQKLIDHLRRENLRRHEKLPDDPGACKQLIVRNDPSRELERGEEEKRRQDTMTRLKPNLREVLEAYLHGESAAEAANRLRIPIETYQSRLKRIKGILREDRRRLSR
jgi:RNA polymerase sigma factor (sigma-70 family)